MANNGSLHRSENDPGVMSHLAHQLGLARSIGWLARCLQHRDGGGFPHFFSGIDF